LGFHIDAIGGIWRRSAKLQNFLLRTHKLVQCTPTVQSFRIKCLVKITVPVLLSRHAIDHIAPSLLLWKSDTLPPGLPLYISPITPPCNIHLTTLPCSVTPAIRTLSHPSPLTFIIYILSRCPWSVTRGIKVKMTNNVISRFVKLQRGVGTVGVRVRVCVGRLWHNRITWTHILVHPQVSLNRSDLNLDNQSNWSTMTSLDNR
jgi:hypothetical protein